MWGQRESRQGKGGPFRPFPDPIGIVGEIETERKDFSRQGDGRTYGRSQSLPSVRGSIRKTRLKGKEFGVRGCYPILMTPLVKSKKVTEKSDRGKNLRVKVNLYITSPSPDASREGGCIEGGEVRSRGGRKRPSSIPSRPQGLIGIRPKTVIFR